MLCLLCLNASDEVIPIFEEQGIDLNVNNVIVQHFWLQPNQDDENCRNICYSCWNLLDTFHKFYQKVEAAHLTFLKTVPATDNGLKEEDQSDCDVFEACEAFLSQGIKIENRDYGEVPPLSLANSLPEKEQSVSAVSQGALQSDAEESDSDSGIPLATLANRTRSAKQEYSLPSSTAECSDHQTPLDNPEQPSSLDETEGKVTNTNTTKRRVRKAKDRKKPDSEDSRPKRKVIDPIKKRELSREFDEVIKKNMKLSCSICHVPIANFFNLRKHFSSVHNTRGYATCCGRKFGKRGVLVDHIYLHLNPEYFKCDKCEKIMADRRSLEVHMNTHDNSKQRIYQCPECPKSFYRKLLLDRHMFTHIPDRKFNCDECEKPFSSKYTLRQHINNVHNSAYMKICEHCGKSIRGLEAFNRHQLKHAGVPVPLVQCDKCGVKLTNKYGLKRHINSMHPETKIVYECKLCGKIAPTAAALQRHTSYMHKCERNHKCPMCDKAFKKPGGLKGNKTCV